MSSPNDDERRDQQEPQTGHELEQPGAAQELNSSSRDGDETKPPQASELENNSETNSDQGASSEQNSGYIEIDTSDQVYEMDIRKKGDILRGKYILGDVLGEGSFAIVKEAVDMQTLARRAIKIFSLRSALRLPGELSDHEIRKVKREIHILSRLSHPNVIGLIEYFSDEKDDELRDYEKNIWMVLEYCAGSVGELLEVEPGHRLPLWQAHLYFVQLMGGLEYLHQWGIIHRDVKPHNLLVNNDNCLKLTDFGTARLIEPLALDNQVGLNQGTPFYDAPEVLLEETGDGHKLDVYSAGTTLYEMVTGSRPFSADNGTAMNASHLQELKQRGHFDMTSDIEQNPGLHDLLHRMLRTDPKKRASVHEVRQHLWCKMQFDYEAVASIPPRGKHGDRYRSMTITSYLHEHHYPLNARVSVPDPRMDEFERKQKVPMVRANRSPPKPRSPSPT